MISAVTGSPAVIALDFIAIVTPLLVPLELLVLLLLAALFQHVELQYESHTVRQSLQCVAATQL